jgi:hypothetical protein
VASTRLALARPGEILRSQGYGVVLDIAQRVSIVVMPDLAASMMTAPGVRVDMLETREMVKTMPQQPGRPVEDD